MPFVLDVSVAATWAFPDENHPQADAAFARLRNDYGLVPGLWWFEIRNVLIVNERRQRLTEADTATFLRDLEKLRIVRDIAPDHAEIMRLARTHLLTVYDTAYLELAQRQGVALATLDDALIRAAHVEAVPIVGEK
ncbi:MAG: type II toxin-antitoxin system VapC family toxin [Silvibacterium sp.]|nr:type II toxin-antitoxin system VapC family toxin [Silvibacterium sp.]